jgi:hypothetical protein
VITEIRLTENVVILQPPSSYPIGGCAVSVEVVATTRNCSVLYRAEIRGSQLVALFTNVSSSPSETPEQQPYRNRARTTSGTSSSVIVPRSHSAMAASDTVSVVGASEPVAFVSTVPLMTVNDASSAVVSTVDSRDRLHTFDAAATTVSGVEGPFDGMREQSGNASRGFSFYSTSMDEGDMAEESSVRSGDNSVRMASEDDVTIAGGARRQSVGSVTSFGGEGNSRRRLSSFGAAASLATAQQQLQPLQTIKLFTSRKPLTMPLYSIHVWSARNLNRK